MVVAEIHRRSPRAKDGFKRFEASIDPSALPAPTKVCISSIKSIISPFDNSISLSSDFSRSSNSPRNFAPATNNPKSKESNLFPDKDSGTSPFAIRSAIPSAIAVFPTPGDPMRTGLFLVRRLKTCIVRRISSSLPIMGSIFPSCALFVRSLVNLFNESNVFSAFKLSANPFFLISCSARPNAFSSTPHFRKIWAAL